MSDASEVEAPDWARAVPSAAPAEVLRRRAATRPTAPLGAHGSLGAGLRDLVRDLMAQEEPLRSHGAAPPARGPDAPQPRHTARRTERPAGREGLPAGAFAVPWRSEVLVDAPRSAGGLSREERAARDSARSRALAAAELALDLHYSTFRSGLHAARPERGEHREAVQEAQPAEGDWNGEQMLPFCDVHSDGGSYDDEYGPGNLFEEASPLCYCSVRRSSINVTAQLDGPGSFTVTSIELRTPSLGYTSPLGQAILFTSFGKPDVAATKRFDEVFSEHEFHALVSELHAQPEAPSAPGLEVPAPAAFICTSQDRITARLDVPRAGRWILLKLLRPREPSGDNIDVQFVGCRGWRSARAFGARDVC